MICIDQMLIIILQVLSALDAEYVTSICTRMPSALVDSADSDVPLSTLSVQELDASTGCVSMDHSPLMPLSVQSTSAALAGYASSGGAVNALFPASAVRDPRRLLPAASAINQTLTVAGRAVDSAAVLLAQTVPFMVPEQAEVSD